VTFTSADRVFVAFACGLLPAVNLAIAVGWYDAIAEANLAAYAASIVKWGLLGAGALVIGRRGGMSWEDLYLDVRDSFIVRRPGSALAAALLFVVVVNFSVLPRFAAAYGALGLPPFAAPYLAMPKTLLGRAIAVLCGFAAAAGSEVLYRGYLRVLAERYFRRWWIAAIVVSAVFGWAHAFYGLYGALYTGLNGFAFVLFARATRCLYVVILAHMLFDVMVFALS
jgi:membrane protease YdiL (CAAX protease family)